MNLGGRIIFGIFYAMLVDHVGVYTYSAVWEFLALVAFCVAFSYLMDALLWLVKEAWSARDGIIRSVRGES